MSVCGRLYPSFFIYKTHVVLLCDVTFRKKNVSPPVVKFQFLILFNLRGFFFSLLILSTVFFFSMSCCFNLVHNKVEKMLEMTAVSLIGGP